jgi:hypothetical protein
MGNTVDVTVAGVKTQHKPVSIQMTADNNPNPGRHKIAWVDHPQRDPFRLDLGQKLQIGNPLERTSFSNLPVDPPLLLRAVVMGDQNRTAVINRTIVKEGDNIEGVHVLAIQSDGVWLQGPYGRQFLTFLHNETNHEAS